MCFLIYSYYKILAIALCYIINGCLYCWIQPALGPMTIVHQDPLSREFSQASILVDCHFLLPCVMHPWVYLTPNSLYLLLSLPFISLPLLTVTPSLSSICESASVLLYTHSLLYFWIPYISDITQLIVFWLFHSLWYFFLLCSFLIYIYIFTFTVSNLIFLFFYLKPSELKISTSDKFTYVS